MLKTTQVSDIDFLSVHYKHTKRFFFLKRRNFFLFLFFFFLSGSFVLGNGILGPKNDSVKVLQWLQNAKTLKPDTALLLLDSAERLSAKLHSKYLLMKVYMEKGDIQRENDRLKDADSSYFKAYVLFSDRRKDTTYLSLLKKLAICSYYLGSNPQVLDYSMEGLKVARKLQNLTFEGTFNNILGITMSGMGNDADAFEYYRQALAVFTRLNSPEKIASVEINLGVLSEHAHDLAKAETHYRKALVLAEKIHDTGLIAASYNNLANLYSDRKDYKTALRYTFRSLALSRKIADQYTEAMDLNNIGDGYQKLGKYDSAFYYFNKAFEKARKIHDHRTMSVSLSSLAELLELKNDIPQALQYANQSWQIVKKGGDVADKLYALKILERLYAKQKAYGKAYRYLRQYVTLYDSIYSAKNRARLEKVKLKYAFKAKDQTLKLAEERQKLFRAYLMVTLFALLLVLGFAIFMIRVRSIRSRELKKRISFVDSLLEYSESYVLMLDRNLRISYLSPSYQKAFGHTIEERRGGNPFDFVHPDDVEEMKKQLKDFFSGKLPRVEITFRLKKKDGEYRYMQGVFNNRLDQPELNGYVLNFWDVTELEKTRKAISENEKKYFEIFNAFPDIYFRINADGIITEISPSVKSVAGYDRQEVLGKTLYDFVEMDREWPRVRKILQRMQHVKDYSLTLRTKNGNEIFCSLNIHDLKDTEGHFAGFHGVLRDITDRVRAEKQLRRSEYELKEANSSKDKILSIIGHDLLGPIGTQKSILDMVIGDVEDFSREEILSLLKTMKPSLDATFSMIENLLSWARIMRRSIHPRLQPGNVAEVVQKSFDLLEQQAAFKKIRLVYEGEKEVRAVFDKNLIDIVIRNLISNAIKFSHPGGDIRVSAVRKDKEVEVCIHDQGMGLSKEDIHKILKEKEKMESRPGTRKEKGTGLGLVVVKEFIQLNKGKLRIESEPGKGTSFCFTLPVA